MTFEAILFAKKIMNGEIENNAYVEIRQQQLFHICMRSCCKSISAWVDVLLMSNCFAGLSIAWKMPIANDPRNIKLNTYHVAAIQVSYCKSFDIGTGSDNCLVPNRRQAIN